MLLDCKTDCLRQVFSYSPLKTKILQWYFACSAIKNIIGLPELLKVSIDF